MTDAELSAELARALGWKDVYPPYIHTWWSNRRGHVLVSEGVAPRGHMLKWRKFDYRDPTVYGPLVAWLMKEHEALPFWDDEDKSYYWQIPERIDLVRADTLHEAVAKAVIAVRSGKSSRLVCGLPPSGTGDWS